MRGLLSEVLLAEGYSVDAYADGLSWLNACHGVLDRVEGPRRWKAIVCDVRMPGLSGPTALRVARLNARWFPPVIVITAFGSADTYADARDLGALAVLDKPFDMDDLVARIREIAPLCALRKEDQR